MRSVRFIIVREKGHVPFEAVILRLCLFDEYGFSDSALLQTGLPSSKHADKLSKAEWPGRPECSATDREKELLMAAR